MKRLRLATGFVFFVLALASAGVAFADTPAEDTPTTTPIKHFIFLMQENHSFDNYFGTYPGAEGFSPDTCMPIDPYDPQNTGCVKPFHIEGSGADIVHSRRAFEGQFNNGRMDGFVYTPQWLQQTDGAIAMGYYDDRDIPYYWNIADEYVLFDRFFSSAAGGSLVNHVYWLTATPGNSGRESIPEEGYGDLPTIFDRLQERGISWKFYVQNYDPNIHFRAKREDLGDRVSQVVWAPLLAYDRYINDQELARHIVDLDQFYEDLQNDTLPAVAYLVPSGASEHPPGSIQSGQRFVRGLINALMSSKAWSRSAFMWAYDDWGGWYDHVPPPQIDEFGYGFRVPALLVSPYARRGFVDSTEYDYTSALKFIQENWNVPPLATRDARAQSFVKAFDFSQPPRAPQFISTERVRVARPEARGLVIYIAYGAGLVLALALISRALFGARVARRAARLRSERMR